MSIALIESELRAHLTSAVIDGWPIRWMNEPWAAGILLSQGNLPLNADGSPAPCIVAENLIGADISDVGGPGQRLSLRLGMLRIHLLVGQNSGTTALNAQIDALWPAFKRRTPYSDPSQWQRLTTMDPRIGENEAIIEDGDRASRTMTVPWEFYYQN